MRIKIIHNGPTHEDALRAKNAAMLRGLTEIVMYGQTAADREIARRALAAASEAYRAGVFRAVD